MLNVKGYYEHGHIFFTEEPPVSSKTEVIITFLTEDTGAKKNAKRQPGGLKGLVTIPDNFNEPLVDLKDYM